MDPSSLLTELYKVAKQENVFNSRVQDLEFAFESAKQLSSRFEFERAVDIFQDIIIGLQGLTQHTSALRLQARALTELGSIRRDQGIISGTGGAYSLYKKAQFIWNQLGEKDKLAILSWYLGACFEMRKNYDQAFRNYNDALTIIDSIGDLKILRGRVLLRIGTVLTKLENFTSAEQKIRESLSLLESRVTPGDYGYSLQKLAIVEFTKGKTDIAQNLVSDTLKVIPQTDKFRITQTNILLADLLLSSDEVTGGLEAASKAETLAQEYGFTHQLSSLYNVINKHADGELASRTDISNTSEGELLNKAKQIASRLDVYTLEQLASRFGFEYKSIVPSNPDYIRLLIKQAVVDGRIGLFIEMAESASSKKLNIYGSPSESRNFNKSLLIPTVGIITALPEEYIAVKVLIDGPVNREVPGRGAGRRYLQGGIPSKEGSVHQVILALADMGNNIAASRATMLLEHFPSVNSIIMVGIAGGIPYPEKPSEHVRLGDIVVSDQRGVIQYDFDKETITETIFRYPPRPPSAFLLEGVRLLKAAELEGKRPWINYIDYATKQLGVTRPSGESDILVNSINNNLVITHPYDLDRVEGEPRIFIGSIASANKLLKNPLKRDELRNQFNVKAVEMEGSGIADATWNHQVGYLVIRGICDYCDKNKGDNWQKYASIAAAAYTRALLESIPNQE